MEDSNKSPSPSPNSPSREWNFHSDGGSKKRKNMKDGNLLLLESQFQKTQKPNRKTRIALAEMIPGMTERSIQVWFQNRRIKYKKQIAERSSLQQMQLQMQLQLHLQAQMNQHHLQQQPSSLLPMSDVCLPTVQNYNSLLSSSSSSSNSSSLLTTPVFSPPNSNMPSLPPLTKEPRKSKSSKSLSTIASILQKNDVSSSPTSSSSSSTSSSNAFTYKTLSLQALSNDASSPPPPPPLTTTLSQKIHPALSLISQAASLQEQMDHHSVHNLPSILSSPLKVKDLATISSTTFEKQDSKKRSNATQEGNPKTKTPRKSSSRKNNTEGSDSISLSQSYILHVNEEKQQQQQPSITSTCHLADAIQKEQGSMMSISFLTK